MRINNILTCIFFLLTIGAVMLFQLFDFENKGPRMHLSKHLSSIQNTNDEVKNATIKTKFQEVVNYKEGFKTFYDENFTLEPRLFNIYGTIQSSVFSVNPLPKKVVAGDDGWLFLGEQYSNVIKKSKGIVNFSEKLRLKIKERLVENNSWLSEKGIKYYVAVAPNKHSVYGEFLPIKESDKILIREQLAHNFKGTEVNWIYLGKTFHKPHNELLYYKTDSHWNALGSFLGYRTLISYIQGDFPHLEGLSIGDFQKETDTVFYKDLSKMLKKPIEEISTKFIVKSPLSIEVDDELEIPKYYSSLPENYERRYKGTANGLKVVVFTDSFGNALIPYLKETFGETVVLIYCKFDKNIIEKEAPDIVIHELAERSIESFLWN